MFSYDFQTSSRKYAKVSFVGSYVARSHFYLATSFRTSLVNYFQNLASASVNMVLVSVDIVSEWKISVASLLKKLSNYWRLACSVNQLLNDRRWLRRKCSFSLYRSLLPPKIRNWVSRISWFVLVACSRTGNVVNASMMFPYCSVTFEVWEVFAFLFLLGNTVLSSVSMSACCGLGGLGCETRISPFTRSGEYSVLVRGATLGFETIPVFQWEVVWSVSQFPGTNKIFGRVTLDQTTHHFCDGRDLSVQQLKPRLNSLINQIRRESYSILFVPLARVYFYLSCQFILVGWHF